MGNILSTNGQKTLYKASFLGKNSNLTAEQKTSLAIKTLSKVGTYVDRNRTYSTAYNMPNNNKSSPNGIKKHMIVEPKNITFDTITQLGSYHHGGSKLETIA
jgi:ABC-type antimicrobial peptide transport system ATPase subunit